MEWNMERHKNLKDFFKKELVTLGIMILLFWAYCSGNQTAADEPKRMEKGIKFNVPPNWPIEEKGGGLAPMPVEDYVLKRFKEIEGQLKELEKSLAEKNQAGVDPKFQNDLATKLEVISAQFKALSSDVQALRTDIQDFKDSQSRLNTRLDAMDKERADVKKLMHDLEERVNFLKFQLKL